MIKAATKAREVMAMTIWSSIFQSASTDDIAAIIERDGAVILDDVLSEAGNRSTERRSAPYLEVH